MKYRNAECICIELSIHEILSKETKMGYTTYKLETAEFNHRQPIEKTVETRLFLLWCRCHTSDKPLTQVISFNGKPVRGLRKWSVLEGVMNINNPKVWNSHLWFVYGVWYEYVKNKNIYLYICKDKYAILNISNRIYIYRIYRKLCIKQTYKIYSNCTYCIPIRISQTLYKRASGTLKTWSWGGEIHWDPPASLCRM